jgi:16S rRNA (guanine1207-N2)-methyltransferase
MDTRAIETGISLGIEQGVLSPHEPLLVINSHYSAAWQALPLANHQQHFFPEYERLRINKLRTTPEISGQWSQLIVVADRVRERNRLWLYEASQHTASQGRIVCWAPNEYGAKSTQKDFSTLFGEPEVETKRHCRFFWTTAPYSHGAVTIPPEWSLEPDGTVSVSGTELLAKVGNFSYDHPDRASTLLLTHLPQLHGAVCDLGAGYGYLSCTIGRTSAVTSLALIEADYTALEMARRNIEATVQQQNRTFLFLWADATACSRLPDALGSFDWVVTNPPFHVGATEDRQLGVSFLQNAITLLKKGGTLVWVANKHLPYAKLLGLPAHTIRCLGQDDSFAVVAYNHTK